MFYTAFLDAGKHGDKSLSSLTERSYNAMTANGDVELSYHIYKLSFLNFLLGRQPNGPGQFMFGTIEWGRDTSWLEEVEAMEGREEPDGRERRERIAWDIR